MDRTYAANLLDAKLALEAEIKEPLYLALRRYIQAWITSDGTPTPMARAEHQVRIEALLKRHYARVAMVVTGRKPPFTPTLGDAALSLSHAHSMAARAKKQADLLLSTIDRGFRTGQSMMQQSTAHDDGTKSYDEFKAGDDDIPQPPPNPANPSDNPPVSYTIGLPEIGQTVADKLRSRMGAIANVQTNGTAEEARREEAYRQMRARVEVVQDGQENVRLIQVWHNVGDNRVRGAPHNPRPSAFDHWSCEGQERPIDEPFTITGELLRFPGDSSLGASIGNLANCRCYLSTIAVHPDGRREEIYTSASAPTRRYRRPNERVNNRPTSERTPTSRVTLNGTTRARVILKDGTLATMRQATPSQLEVLINGRVVGRGDIVAGKLTNVVIDPKNTERGIEDLMRRSVETPRIPSKTP